jgi:UDP-N-acetylglucosamine 2-epimerase
MNEGINENMIFVTRNTIVDVVYQNVEIAQDRSSIMDELSLEIKGYLLATAHRQENVDDIVGGLLAMGVREEAIEKAINLDFGKE